MKHTQYDALMEQKQYEEIIKQLEEELQDEYEELLMLNLGKAYLAAGEEKKARKVAKKCYNLFPAGDYIMEIEELLECIEQGRTSEYLQNLAGQADASKEQAKPVADASKEQTETAEQPQHRSSSISLSEMFKQNRKKEKKPVKIPGNIKECFEGVVGMENVQIEMDKFYKLLRFQNERRESKFNAELLKSTHFAIAGPRGSGKTLVGEIISGLLYEFGIRADKSAVRLEARELLMAYENDRVEGIKELFDKVSDATVIIENVQDISDDNMGGHDLKNIAVGLRRVMGENKDRLSVVLTGTGEAVTKLQILDDELQDILYSVIEIQPYSLGELLEIAKKLATAKALRIHPSAEKVLLRKIRMECRSPEFLNAITLKRYLDQAAVKMAQRYYEGEDESDAAKAYLMPEDFEVEMEDESLDELLAKLDNLTGLKNVKAQIRKRIETIAVEQQSEAKGAHRETGHGTLHMLFTGNPGTGKTTVAALVGKIWQQLGILPNGGQIVSCTRSDLVGQYQGQTAPLVRAKVKEAMGGILFIDEAYSLCRDDKDTFGHEAVDELIAAIENNKDYMMVILAGYKEEMYEFLKSNPGFKSRIRNEVEFEDYTVEEMVSIFKKMVAERSMQLEPDMDEGLRHMIEQKSKVPDFGNARGVRNLFDEVIEEMNARLVRMNSSGMHVSAAMYDLITKEDIRTIAGRKTDEEKSLEELMEELNGLTGLASVKAKVQEMVDDIRVKEYMRQAGIEHAQGHGTLHLVFKGNAGTGKTTVARLLGKIYKKLGLLQKNVFVETGRKDLVGQYQGHTAKKVLDKIKEAQGGILFIDEAYTLMGGEHDEFGLEAINTLVAELENRRENLMVIVAGYAQEMEKFLDANQGLASRLSNEICFEDYTDEELLLIFRNMVSQKGMQLAEGLDQTILRRIREEKAGMKDFGNARGVRNIVEQVEKKKNSRIARKMSTGGEIDRDEVVTIIESDIA
ncbi:MAG: AAA family ATPase [Clostridium sp.]|nr:AAA family ATPase [Acetatifactor muris]MCM1526785.1 AAA family ATPase [Bacteroides sp.]MCM1563014.1 AAA family ATPase [Clostridium sp.]